MKLSDLTDNISDLVTERGYKRRGNLFAKKESGLYKQLWYQGRRPLFTITMQAIIEFPDQEEVKLLSPLQTVHWMSRVGDLMPEGQDVWWNLEDPDGDLDVLTEQRRILRKLVLPRLEMVSAQWIVGTWLSGWGTGIPLKLQEEFLERSLAAGIRPASG